VDKCAILFVSLRVPGLRHKLPLLPVSGIREHNAKGINILDGL